MKPLTLLVHGDSGTGKTHLGFTTPTPRLVIDAEGGSDWQGTDESKVVWDLDPQQRQRPSEIIGDADTVVTTITIYKQMETVMQWLESGQHPFKSVVIDSLTEIQKRCMDNVTGTEQAQLQDWGTLLRKMEGLSRRFRDLTLQKNNPMEVVVVLCGTMLRKDGKMAPHVQGQLAQSLPYFFSVEGHLTVEGDPESGLVRKLQVQPINNIAAKDRTGKLGVYIENPNVTAMRDLLTQGEING